MHFISVAQLHITLQVIVAMGNSGDRLDYVRPASLSTINPRHRVGGHWKTPHCRELEQALLLEKVSAAAPHPYH